MKLRVQLEVAQTHDDYPRHVGTLRLNQLDGDLSWHVELWRETAPGGFTCTERTTLVAHTTSWELVHQALEALLGVRRG